MGQFRGMIVILGLLVGLTSPTHASMCSRFFYIPPKSDFHFVPENSDLAIVRKFWKQIDYRNSTVRKNVVSAHSNFAYVLQHISRFLEAKKQYDIDDFLINIQTKYGKRYTYAYLLYLLSFSEKGRDIIKNSLIFLNGSDFWQDNMHARFLLRSFNSQGEMDYLGKNVPILTLNSNLRVAPAVAYLAHEITHLRNAAQNAGPLSHIKNNDLWTIADEILAYQNQMIVVKELLQHSPFLAYKQSYEEVSSQSFYFLTKTELIKMLTAEYKFKKSDIKILLEDYPWPEL